MALILDGTNGLSDVDGSAATPAIRGSDTNTGIFFPAADTIAFAEGGVESMRLDSNGNVGIGTSSPGSRLNVSSGAETVLRISALIDGSNATPRAASLSFFGGSGNAETARIASFNRFFNLNETDMVFSTRNSSNAFVERMRIDTSGSLQFNSGYGSVATAYGCRAWVNFDGTGTPAIEASGNVSSITDLGTGRFRVNFSTQMPDAKYAASWDTVAQTTNGMDINTHPGTLLTTSIECQVRTPGGSLNDPTYIGLTVTR
jgi:hypothetical protein